MPTDLSLWTLESVSRRLMARSESAPAPALHDLPLYGSPESGQVQMLEPAGPPPGLWTRFKGALVGLPLIGQLRSIQRAADETRLAREYSTRHQALSWLSIQFHAEFERKLKATFGETVCRNALEEESRLERERAERMPGKQPTQTPAQIPQTLTARKIVGVMQAARRMATRIARSNAAATAEEHGLACLVGGLEWEPLLRNYAAALDLADREELSGRRLEGQRFQPLKKDLSELGETLLRLEFLPMTDEEKSQVRERLWEANARFATQLENGTPEELQRIAKQFTSQLARVRDQLSLLERSRKEGCTRAHQAGFFPWNADDNRLVRLLCAHTYGEHTADTNQLSDHAIREVWEKLISVHGELMKELKCDAQTAVGLLRRCAPGKSAVSPDELRQMGCRLAITDGTMSMLHEWRKARYVPEPVHGLPTTGDSLHGVPDVPPKAALTEQLLEGMRSGLLVGRLGPDLGTLPGRGPQPSFQQRVKRTYETLRKDFDERVAEVQHGHQEALRSVEKASLTPLQRQLLQERGPQFAHGLAWLHPQQVSGYLRLARAIAQRLPAIREALRTDDPAAIFDHLSALEAGLGEEMRAIREGAQQLGLSHTLEGDDVQRRVLELCVRLALAQDAESPPAAPPAGAQVPAATAPSAGSSTTAPAESSNIGAQPSVQPQAGEPGHRPEREFDDAGTQLRQLLGRSQQPSAAWMLALYEGLRPGLPATLPTDSRDRGDDAPLYLARPELLARTLVQPLVKLDERGVLEGSPAMQWVAEKFELRPIAETVAGVASEAPPEELLPDMLRATLQGGRMLPSDRLPQGLVAHGADIVVNGERLTLEQASDESLAGQFHKAIGQSDIAHRIGQCMACGVLDRFREKVDHAAFGASVPMAHLRSVHEVWQLPDGSWRVRSTHVSHPLALGGHESVGGIPVGSSLPLHAEGVVLYTLTHRIAVAEDGKPRAVLEHDHCHVTFAF